MNRDMMHVGFVNSAILAVCFVGNTIGNYLDRNPFLFVLALLATVVTVYDIYCFYKLNNLENK